MSRGPRRAWRLAVLALVAAAVATEWMKPEADRTWEGEVLGFVPYSFKPPTWQRIRDAYWNERDDRLFTPRVFGVGWAVNLHRAYMLVSGAYAGLGGRPSPSHAEPSRPSRSSTKSSARP